VEDLVKEISLAFLSIRPSARSREEGVDWKAKWKFWLELVAVTVVGW
jgi:hypothetical protein